MTKKKKRSLAKNTPETTPSILTKSSRRQSLLSTGLYCIIAAVLTYPLIFRMNSSVYGPYDHVTTDLFAIIYVNFWSLKETIFNFGTSLLNNPLLAAPFETRMPFVNLTGFFQLPLSVIFGHLFTRNFNILFNLVASGLGMFLLVRYITKSAGAGFIAGIIFAFCPNMMVRSYTTFDSTQTQWIPFYTLYVLKFIDNRTWRNAILSGFFLVCNIVIAFPYYLVYLPVHTVVLLAACAAWHIWGEKKGLSGFIKDLASSEALKAYMKIAVILVVAVVIFAVYYQAIVGGGSAMESARRTTEQLEELALKPLDYLMPHPRSALLKGDIKQLYWDDMRPGKNPDSFVAYIGYIALALMLIGIVTGRGCAKWIFIAGAVVAFWSTLGPNLFGIPTPSGLIHSLYAPFARRILIYKVFVQMCIACLAGMGISYILGKLKNNGQAITFLSVLSVLILLEYSLVPPSLSVNLKHTPKIYEKVKELPDNSIIIEVPARRNNGNIYQGYPYYQITHGKRLFNPVFGLSGVPERLQPFYTQMDVPIESCEYCNLAALRYLGVTHLVYHKFIQTRTVIFNAFVAPALYNGTVEGLKQTYECLRVPDEGYYPGPYDYTFADLYEITAEPSPVALIFDYHSPYDKVPGIMKNDYMVQFGWVSALLDTTSTFYYPLPNALEVDRVMRQGGKITAVNLSDKPVDINITFYAASADSARIIETKWNGRETIGRFEIGPKTKKCMVESIRLKGSESGVLSIWSENDQYGYQLGTAQIPAFAVLKDFRVIVKNN